MSNPNDNKNANIIKGSADVADSQNISSDTAKLGNEEKYIKDGNDFLLSYQVETQIAKLISPFVHKIFDYSIYYSICSAAILLLSGCSAIPFTLHTSTLNFIVGTNMASVVGLQLAIIKGILKLRSERP